jgi:hypothetical protein
MFLCCAIHSLCDANCAAMSRFSGMHGADHPLIRFCSARDSGGFRFGKGDKAANAGFGTQIVYRTVIVANRRRFGS